MTDQTPRTVCQYRGMQIRDARETIQVVIDGEIPRGVRWSLRNEGFTRQSDTMWEAPATPMSIAAAQAIGGAFFEKETT